MKIITVCGSLKYKEEIMRITEEMTLQGNCMLSMIYPTNPDISVYTDEERELFGKLHKERIRLSDAILVVNIDHYIGSSTKSEIAFAKELNKEIILYTDMIQRGFPNSVKDNKTTHFQSIEEKLTEAEKEIENGETYTEEEVWKMFNNKYKFDL